MRGMAASVLALGVLAGCDPVWGVNVRVQHPGGVAVEDATVAVACGEGHHAPVQMAARTTPDGKTHIGGIGDAFPVGCDIYVAKPGFETQRIRYVDLCPNGPDGCDRMFAFDLVLVPMQQ